MNGHPRRVGSRRSASAPAEASRGTTGTPEKVVVALCLLGGYALVFLLVSEWNAYSASAAIGAIDPRTAWDAYIPFRAGGAPGVLRLAAHPNSNPA